MTTPPTPAEAFETFYKEVRDRLLLQAWSLTGDLSAAQGAVRHALVVAWHHWGKLRRLPDDAARESWVRPIAWQHAQRRHTVPHLHRDRGIDEESRATLAALGGLTTTQRRVLLLAHFAPVSLDQLAREVGITHSRAERELATATTQFAARRDVPTTGIRQAFEPLAAHVAAVRWPRPPIVMRAGARRRRLHAVLGALVATVALVAAGLVVHSGTATPSTLAALGWHDRVRASAPPAAARLTPSRMLTGPRLGTALGGSWTTSLTSDSGSTTLPCAPRAAASRHPAAVLVRTFAGPTKHDTAGESVEVAATGSAAAAAYATAVRWYAGCSLPRLQLVSAERLTGVGDTATVLGLRDWSSPHRSLVVGVARSGSLLTTVVASVPRVGAPATGRLPALLGRALRPVCSLPGAGACVGTPTAERTTVPRVGGGLLETVDLPPATGITQPWAATSPAPARSNPAASHCDDTSFAGGEVGHGLTRSFVLTKDSPSVLFGISETAGTLPSAGAATSFVEGIESRLGTCAKRELGSAATRLPAPPATAGAAISLWHVSVGATHHRSTIYLMALVRRGSTVAQLSFVPAGSHTIAPAAFAALAERAAERLAGFGAT